MGSKWTRITAVALVVLLVALALRKRDGSRGDEGGGGGTADGGAGKRPLSALTNPDGFLDRAAGARSADIEPALTWAALRAQPPIEFEGGGVARVAIEADSVPVSGGVLIYCLAEHGDSVPEPGDEETALGPLDCHILRPGTRLEELASLSHIDLPIPQRGELLYAKALVITEPGEHRVLITRRDKRTAVAEMVVQGVESDYHAWVPFGRCENRGEKLGRDVSGEGDAHFETIAVNGKGRALPAVNGLMPIDWIAENEERLEDAPLPRLVPVLPDGGLTIEATDRGFVLEAEEEIIVARPDWHLLARWWVNGEPFAPEPIEEVSDQNGLMRFGKRTDIALEFDPATLGAQSGDRIGLQVLHLPNGWEYVREDSEQLTHMLEMEEGRPAARMSNRIEFEAP